VSVIDPVTGRFLLVDLSNPTGSGYIVDENTGNYVLDRFGE
jgi:hypothetical protein